MNLRWLEIEREETSRLNRHVEELKKAHHQSENKMSHQLRQIAKEKEDLIRYVNTPQATFNPSFSNFIFGILLIISISFLSIEL